LSAPPALHDVYHPAVDGAQTQIQNAAPAKPAGRIRKLPLSLVNRIAAGEVIERPASVVKELVENSLDAGATRITVEVEDGGLGLIRVSDDGSGILPDDLPLALAEHATSKIESDDDLFRISTKGFRGEALASIGSVSHLRIVSTRAQAVGGAEITCAAGELSEVKAAAGNQGTGIEVRNLFFNTPARRKFMKGPGTEFGHISEMLLKLAIPHPGVEFQCSHNGRVALRLAATDPIGRMLEAWPDDFHDRHLVVSSGTGPYQLSGIIGLPELAHPTAKHQYLYVNGRPIRDKFVGHALKEAYRGLTEPGRQPAAVLMLTVPADEVDVNVHPTKIEVRFRDSSRVHGLVMSVVREALLGADVTPRAAPRVDAAGSFSAALESSTAAPVPSDSREGMMRRLAEFFSTPLASPVAEQPLLPLHHPPAYTPAYTPAPPTPAAIHNPTQTAALAAVSPAAPAVGFHPPPSANVPPAPATISEPPASPAAALQLHNTYLVVETADGMQIIDQHALHERIIFEDLMSRVRNGNLESQRLLIPPTLRVSDRQLDLLEQVRPLLERLGLEVAPAGPGLAMVTAFPSLLGRLDAGDFVAELLEKGEQEVLDLSEEELLHDVLDMMSCKAAVKAGDPLTPEQIRGLLARRQLIERDSNCPHGRPTTLKLSLKDLEKQFKRSGF
jgi:DNA mismatch repair protein MutL